MLDLRPLTSLSWRFAITFVVLWNLGCGLAFALGAPDTKAGGLVGGATAVAASLVALAIVLSEPFRQLATHPDRRGRYRPGIFLFLSLVAGVIGCGWIGKALSMG